MPQSKKGNMDINIAEAVEGEDALTYAGSLPVPNVQEMERSNPMQVPERYIRNQEDMPKTTDAIHLSCEIPVIDLSLLSNGHKEELKKLELACEEWGFFQVVNHGVAEEVLQGMKYKEKNKYAMASDDIQGYGQAFVVSEEQKLDWSDILVLVIYPTRFRKLKFWPNAPKEFKEKIEVYSNEVKRVGEELLCSLSLIMGMDKDTLLGLHKEFVQALRVNYYPTCSIPDQVLGISPHSDTSILTILMQDDDVTGLQIKHSGEWVPVKPIPNALVVNIGDVIENRARISFASFILPHDDVEIEPFDHLVDSQQPIKIYKKVRYGDYLRHSMKRKMEGKVHTEMAKNEN
ncbi:hypothetical protein AAG906_035987 [Vitis piasezkii]